MSASVETEATESREKRPRAAQRIQEAAKELFYKNGIRATGIEEVCRAADATKMSLYRAFSSKDALIAAILEEDGQEMECLMDDVCQCNATPRQKLERMIDMVCDMARQPGQRGCPLLLAQSEFPEPHHPAHRIVADVKARKRARMAQMAADAGAQEPVVFADALGIMMEGAWFTLPFMGAERTEAGLRAAAAALFKAHLPD
ncbi:TetR/AcrR family transcriptional regulator [Rhodovarius crocodyli]|uniref:TetR/AcrR family transcriptional regulator n=1 Tax=Rhodovarius crocodyli TaxID=1979269 RepID=A0A437M260_9PROT|nr:TetR/AcrR family transcriptional regulator [Rhodovarius crocodyli]RVT91799.1 TetR/AcrR family transcriptional regulator [Rhodovarius crocodyli]